MHIRVLSTTLAVLALIAAGCSDNTQEQSPGEVLARDSSLASDLRQIDTSAFSEAADVAMAPEPDSAPTTRAPAAAVPTPATPRAPIRPAPATIHPEPITRRTLPPPRPAPSNGGPAPATPSATAILERVPGATLPAAADPCGSPTPTDQRRCLMTRLARSDVALDRSYQALIAQMKREAGTPAGAKEPETVQRLRVAQRAWLVYRDTECRRRNRDKEGPLWAPVRARCLAEFSSQREEELSRALLER